MQTMDYDRLSPLERGLDNLDPILDQVEAVLAKAGIACQRTPGLVQYEVSQDGRVFEACYVVSARAAFASFASFASSANARRAESEFSQFQTELVNQDFGYDQHKLDRSFTLIFVGTTEDLASQDVQEHRYRITEQQGVARKYVLNLDEFRASLKPLFSPVEDKMRSLRSSDLRLATARDNADIQALGLVATHSLSYRDALRDANRTGAALELLQSSRGTERQVLENLFSRIMGGGQKLVFFADGIELAWAGESRGTPLPYASSGEQVALGLAMYLARFASDIDAELDQLDDDFESNKTPELGRLTPRVLGILGIVNTLDFMRQLSVLDILRELSAATDTLVLLQTPDSQIRSYGRKLFERRFGAGCTRGKG